MKGFVTMKPLRGVVVPEGVVTVIARTPVAAPGEIVTSRDRLSEPGEVIAAVTPVPLKATLVAPAKPWPERVAVNALPGAPDDGEIDVTAGSAIVKPVKGALVPAGD